jgi:transposase
VFVGLDAHKKEHKIAVFLPGCDRPEEWTIRNEPLAIRRWVDRMQRKTPGRQIVVAYEAGVCGFALQRQIQRPGVRCMVIAPSLMPVQAGQRVHTDRRDAANLGRNLRDGRLTEVHPPNEQQEAVRDLCRCREAAMEDLRRVRHQVLKFLLRRGLHYSQGDHWTNRHHDWLGSIRLEDVLAQEVLTGYLGELSHRQERLESLAKRVEALAQEEPYRQKVGWLRCLQGVDTITAMTLLAELYSFERFASPRQLMSYLGLTPSEASSGAIVRKGPITKAGNRRVRRMLIESSWHAPRRATGSKVLRARRKGQPAWAVAIAERAQERLHRRYWRLSGQGKPSNKVVTAVARELVGFVWALLQGPPKKGAAVRRTSDAEAVPVEPARRLHPADGLAAG